MSVSAGIPAIQGTHGAAPYRPGLDWQNLPCEPRRKVIFKYQKKSVFDCCRSPLDLRRRRPRHPLPAPASPHAQPANITGWARGPCSAPCAPSTPPASRADISTDKNWSGLPWRKCRRPGPAQAGKAPPLTRSACSTTKGTNRSDTGRKMLSPVKVWFRAHSSSRPSSKISWPVLRRGQELPPNWLTLEGFSEISSSYYTSRTSGPKLWRQVQPILNPGNFEAPPRPISQIRCSFAPPNLARAE